MSVAVIRRLRAPHLLALMDHLERLALRDGARFDRREVRTHLAECLSSTSRTPCWAALWGAWLEGPVVGHVEVRTEAREEAPHRARMSWRLEDAADGSTAGAQLVAAAVAWSIAHPDLEWLDAEITDDDRHRLAVVRTNGFSIVGRIPDRYRIDGRSIGDVYVTRRVAAWRGHGAEIADRTVGGVTLRLR